MKIYAYIAMWAFTAFAISVAIYFTGRVSCLWFLFIPAVIQLEAINEKEDSNDT